MNAHDTQRAQRAWINELLHRMTMASTQAVRVQLCAELKREITDMLASAATAGGKQ